MPFQVDLVCWPPERVHEIWPHVAPLLRKALRRTGLASFAALENDILNGHGLVWVAFNGRIKAAASTSLQRTEQGLVCLVTACGAPAAPVEWLPLMARIEEYARIENCKCVRIIGRKGWGRIFPDFKETNVILDRIL